MNRTEFSNFELLLIDTQNELGSSVLLILAWLAAGDGTIDLREENLIQNISDSSDYGHDIDPILDIAKSTHIESLLLSCEIIRKHFNGQKAALFMEMAIGVSIADGYLKPSENYILRFIADFL